MARLDVNDVLTDPDFMDGGLICYRKAQIIGDDGIAVINETPSLFSAVVTSGGGDVRRNDVGEIETGSITVHTAFKLQAGADGYTADEILWSGQRWTVEKINNYTNFGRGFVEATCTLKPLSG